MACHRSVRTTNQANVHLGKARLHQRKEEVSPAHSEQQRGGEKIDHKVS